MAEYGEVYAEVDASVVNGGISTLSISGDTPLSGDTSFSVILRWEYYDENNGGFSNKGWFLNDVHNPLSQFDDVDALGNFLTTYGKDGLTNIFSLWSGEDKAAFLNEHNPELWSCITYVSGTNQ